VLALAALAVAANFTNYGAVIPALRAELHASAAQVGLLSTLLYVGIGVTYLPGGLLVDRIGPRRVLCVALLVVGMADAALPAIPQLAWTIACRLVVGLGAGVAILAGSQAARRTGQGALGQGVFGGAMQVGAGIGLFATPTIAQAAGWQGAFWACALLALAASAACRLLMLPDAALARPRQRRFAAAVRSRPLWGLGLVHLASLGLGQAAAPWLGLYLTTVYQQFPLAHAARLAAAGLLVGALVRPLGGALISWRHLRHTTLLRVGTVLVVLGLAMLAAPHQRPWLTAAGLVVFTAGTTLPYAAVFDQAGRIGDAVALGPGAAQGLVSTISAPASAGGPPLIGWLLERSGGFAMPFSVLALFGLAGCASAAIAGGRAQRTPNGASPAELDVVDGVGRHATALAVGTGQAAGRPTRRPVKPPAWLIEPRRRSWRVSIVGVSFLLVLAGLGRPPNCGAGCEAQAERGGGSGRSAVAGATLDVPGTGSTPDQVSAPPRTGSGIAVAVSQVPVGSGIGEASAWAGAGESAAAVAPLVATPPTGTVGAEALSLTSRATRSSTDAPPPPPIIQPPPATTATTTPPTSTRPRRATALPKEIRDDSARDRPRMVRPANQVRRLQIRLFPARLPQ
jgi:nitrate/nitrite transporter NarK